MVKEDKKDEVVTDSNDELVTVNHIVNIKHIKTVILDKNNYYE